MSQPSLVDPRRRRDVPTQKQKTNVYTMMLIISFVFLVTASVLLYLEVTQWGPYPWWNTSEGTPKTSSYLDAPDLPAPWQRAVA